MVVDFFVWKHDLKISKTNPEVNLARCSC